jgi:hypothetical protein
VERAVALGNEGARAGVTSWDRGDIASVASAREGTEASRGSVEVDDAACEASTP